MSVTYFLYNYGHIFHNITGEFQQVLLMCLYSDGEKSDYCIKNWHCDKIGLLRGVQDEFFRRQFLIKRQR